MGFIAPPKGKPRPRLELGAIRLSVRRKNKSRSRVPPSDGTNKRNQPAEEFRKHYEIAIAEMIWCQRRVSGERLGRSFVTDREVLMSCGAHWRRMCREWIAVARSCRRHAPIEARAGHPVVAALFLGVADKLTATNTSRAGAFLKGVAAALELIRWVPEDPTSMEGLRSDAFATIMRLPLLTAPAKREVLQQAFSKPGRPAETRRVAAYALELHADGLTWPQVAARLVPIEQNVANPAQAIRREVQRLKAALRSHGVSIAGSLE